MNKDIIKTVSEKLYECEIHIQKLTAAKKHLHQKVLFSVESYQQIDDVTSSFIDQLVFRFSKLQDTMGESLFKSILIMSQEQTKRKTFIDILNRLEELELIDKVEWLKLREVRNDIAHEYSFNTQEVVDSINDIYYKSDRLIEVFDTLQAFIKEKFL